MELGSFNKVVGKLFTYTHIYSYISRIILVFWRFPKVRFFNTGNALSQVFKEIMT